MTMVLVAFSYCINQLPIGAAIMLVHDSSDIPVTFTKLVFDVTNMFFEILAPIWLFSFWFYMRLYVFPFKIIIVIYEDLFLNPIPHFNYSIATMLFCFLFGLLFLHIYWSYLLVRGAIKKLLPSKDGKRQQITFKGLANRINHDEDEDEDKK